MVLNSQQQATKKKLKEDAGANTENHVAAILLFLNTT
jgi:hypothetical protein